MKVREILYDIVKLKETTDVMGTIDSIRRSSKIKGYNVWLLACGAMLASIGLDTDSEAVIIGAMLVSPLMAPILGIGLSMGINDRGSLGASLQNFLVAVIASLFVSTLYFVLTPLGTPTSMIMSRTYPTLLDVLVAVFGGIAGIVAVSRKDKTNAIPGVAIATALMPPLCVAGFGIANLDWRIFGGAFYLFFINSVFIALSTYGIVRFLKFPYTEYPDVKVRRQALRWIIIIALIAMGPSIYFMYNLIHNQRTRLNINRFIAEHIESPNVKVVDQELASLGDSSVLNLFTTGEYIDNDSVAKLAQGLPDYNLPNTRLHIFQVSPVREDLIESHTKLEVMREIQPLLVHRQNMIDSVITRMEKMERSGNVSLEIEKEVKTLFPDIERMMLAQGVQTDFSASNDTLPVLILEWKPGLYRSYKQRESGRLATWLQNRMVFDTLKVISL